MHAKTVSERLKRTRARAESLIVEEAEALIVEEAEALIVEETEALIVEEPEPSMAEENVTKSIRKGESSIVTARL